MKRWFFVAIAIMVVLVMLIVIRTGADKGNSDVNDINELVTTLNEHGLCAQVIQHQPGRSEYVPVSIFEMWDILLINNNEVYVLSFNDSAMAKDEHDKHKPATDHLFIRFDRYLMYYNGNDEGLISNLELLAGNSTDWGVH